jgi:hypothetical protein
MNAPKPPYWRIRRASSGNSSQVIGIAKHLQLVPLGKTQK